MSEYRSVEAQEFGVPGHAHVRFEILRRFALLIFDAKAKPQWPAGTNRIGILLPNHAPTPGERRDIRRLPRFWQRRSDRLRIVTAGWAGRKIGKIDLGRHCVGKSGGSNDIGEDPIMSR